jgi:hypothetical protein
MAGLAVLGDLSDLGDLGDEIVILGPRILRLPWRVVRHVQMGRFQPLLPIQP